MKRRNFIKLGASASAAALMPFEMMAKKEWEGIKDCDFSKRKLVLINLDGGNDGLNTTIPLNQYDVYSNLRPTIKVPETGLNKYITLDSGLPDNQQLGLHPSLTGFKDLYDLGKMRIMQGIGYPAQNKSHFASSDKYMTGNDGNGWENGKDSGWIGRYMEQMYADELGEDYPFAVQMGSVKNSLGFHGVLEHGMNMNITNQDTAGFYSILSGLGGEAPLGVDLTTDFGIEMDYIIETDKLANIYANSISNAFNAGSNSETYPDTDLANQLKTVARMIKGGLESKIYMVRLPGFDTHAAQLETGGDDILGRHNTLLEILNGAVAAFIADISALGLDDEVVAVTYSEFGRKAQENGNLGTDHGEIAPMFVFGKPIQGGLSGVNPNLNEAIEDNNWQIESVQYDYRSVFGTLLKDWMGGGDTIIDQTFFDHSNSASFNDAVIDELVEDSFKIDDACSTSLREDVIKENEDLSWFASPNPFVNDLNLICENDVEKAFIQVFNQNGQLVKATNVSNSNGKVVLDLSSLANGIYTLNIESEGIPSESIKVVKR